MKKFIEKNFIVILLIFLVLTYFDGCSKSREIKQINKELILLKDSIYTKTELDLRLQIEGLKSEKRMIQSTDRKLLDVNRQSEIDKEIKELENKVK